MTVRPSPLNSLRARLLIGIGFPLVLFTTIAVVALHMLDRLLDAIHLENHSHEVILQGVLQQEALTRMNDIVRLGPVVKPELLWKDYESNRRAFHKANDAALVLVAGSATQREQLENIRRLEFQWNELIEAQFRGRKFPGAEPVA